MALHDVSKLTAADLATPTIDSDPDPHGYADSVRQIFEDLPASVRDALQLDDNRMSRIRFDGQWGEDDKGHPITKVIVPIGRRDDNAVRAFLEALRNTTDLEFNGVIFMLER